MTNRIITPEKMFSDTGQMLEDAFALRLADELATAEADVSLMDCAFWVKIGPSTLDEAAAELRRLHAELERCKATCAATAEGWREDSGDLRLHRDVLLEALDVVLDDLMYKDHARVIDVARAAIATVEGEKT